MSLKININNGANQYINPLSKCNLDSNTDYLNRSEQLKQNTVEAIKNIFAKQSNNMEAEIRKVTANHAKDIIELQLDTIFNEPDISIDQKEDLFKTIFIDSTDTYSDILNFEINELKNDLMNDTVLTAQNKSDVKNIIKEQDFFILEKEQSNVNLFSQSYIEQTTANDDKLDIKNNLANTIINIHNEGHELNHKIKKSIDCLDNGIDLMEKRTKYTNHCLNNLNSIKAKFDKDNDDFIKEHMKLKQLSASQNGLINKANDIITKQNELINKAKSEQESITLFKRLFSKDAREQYKRLSNDISGSNEIIDTQKGIIKQETISLNLNEKTLQQNAEKIKQIENQKTEFHNQLQATNKIILENQNIVKNQVELKVNLSKLSSIENKIDKLEQDIKDAQIELRVNQTKDNIDALNELQDQLDKILEEKTDIKGTIDKSYKAIRNSNDEINKANQELSGTTLPGPLKNVEIMLKDTNFKVKEQIEQSKGTFFKVLGKTLSILETVSPTKFGKMIEKYGQDKIDLSNKKVDLHQENRKTQKELRNASKGIDINM